MKYFILRRRAAAAAPPPRNVYLRLRRDKQRIFPRFYICHLHIQSEPAFGGKITFSRLSFFPARLFVLMQLTYSGAPYFVSLLKVSRALLCLFYQPLQREIIHFYSGLNDEPVT